MLTVGPEDEVRAPAGASRHRFRRWARDVAPAVTVYVAVRLLGLLALVLLARAHGVDAASRLDTYDAPRLLGIAGRGYDPLGPLDGAGRPLHSNIAFYPLYPLAVRLLATVTGMPVIAGGFVVTGLAGIAAAIGLDRLGRVVAGGRTAGLLVVALWACWPHAVVLSMPYTEALFVALAAWSLVALLADRWILCGVLCLLAGATRSVGIALSVAVVVAAVARSVSSVQQGRRPAWPPLVAAALSPLGFLAYWAWLWTRTGRPDAWFWVQAHEWRSTFDGGRFTLTSIGVAATRPQALVLVVCAVVVVASVVLLVALAVQGAPPAVLVYTTLATYAVIGAAGYENSKPRFLLCAFPLVVPLARSLSRAPVRTLVVLLLGVAVVSAWYNAYVLVVWTYSP